MSARQVVEPARGVVGDLVVILHLVGDLCNAGARDGAEIVIPPVDPLSRLAIVGGPAEIGGVNVRRQPLFEAMQLVRPDEMHLAGKAGLVTCRPQMMGEGRDVGSELRGIVVDPRPAWKLPRHEGGACRRAERACGVGVGEAH